MVKKPKTHIRKRKQKRGRFHTRKLRGGTVFDNVQKAKASSNTKKVVVFYNKYHLGDNIFNLKFLYNISNVLKEKGIKVRYLYNSMEVSKPDELNRYVNPDTLSLEIMGNTIPDGATELWLGYPIDGVKKFDLDNYFPAHYTMILAKLGLADSGIDTSLYQKEPYLEDIYKKFDPKFKDLDILIINAEPKSMQVVYHKLLFEKMCVQLSQKYKIATTSPLEGNDSIPCTFRDNLMLQDIGAISTHAKYIIGTHSGPVTPCFTDATRKNMKKMILFADNGTHHPLTNKIIVLPNTYHYASIEEYLT